MDAKKNDIPLAPPRGMRDFYPDEMALRNLVTRAWTEAAARFGFLQYDAPVVESLGLLQRKAGEEIVDQIYSFEDKSGRPLALRPEMTPSLARMIVARQGSLALPLKWFAIAQCFRYERTSRGRKREHFQWNLDVVGEESTLAEVEVIATALDALGALGLGGDDLVVLFSSRALLAELFVSRGIEAQHHSATFLALDKRGKISDEKVGDLLRDSGLDDSSVEAVFSVMAIESLADVEAIVGADCEPLRDVREMLSLLAVYGLADIVRFDISIIRGLDYYTGIIFEAFDAGREYRAIFGGGRYDNLLGDFGGRPASGVGLGFGDVVVAEILADKGWPSRSPSTTAVAVGYMDTDQRRYAVAVARDLRRRGMDVDLALRAEKPRAFFTRVGNGDFAHAAFLGPDDVDKGAFRIKNLADRTESEEPLPRE